MRSIVNKKFNSFQKIKWIYIIEIGHNNRKSYIGIQVNYKTASSNIQNFDFTITQELKLDISGYFWILDLENRERMKIIVKVLVHPINN